MESFLSLKVSLILLLLVRVVVHGDGIDDLQPLSKIAIHRALFAFNVNASLKAEPVLLGTKGEDFQWITVELECPDPSEDDWVAVFSPAKFNSSTCPPVIFPGQEAPHLCTAPIKYKFANDSNAEYMKTGKASLKFRLINQRADFSIALFSGGLSHPKLLAVSNTVTFANPKAPVYPRLSQGKSWNEMAVTWTSGYNIIDAVTFVEWGFKGESQTQSPAGTLTFHREAMCGPPARTIGWRDPGYIHTSFLKDLWPNSLYTYKLGHRLFNGSYIWSKSYYFKSSPYPGQDSLQRVVIFGDMGKAERDGSNDSNEDKNYQPGSLNTTDQLIKDLDNIDILFHIGDITYANGYISQWDQFTSQVEPIASTIPYMIASGNHERDVPGTGSFFETNDSGGECGVLAETMFYVPAENRAKFWYSTDYGMFHFCIADSEHDWREGSEQYKFIEKCLASADRQKQPWLIFAAHRVLGYSSNYWKDGSYGESMGRESLQKLWQKYKVDIAFYGHVHNYERTCPIYQFIYQPLCSILTTHVYHLHINAARELVESGDIIPRSGCNKTASCSSSDAYCRGVWRPRTNTELYLRDIDYHPPSVIVYAGAGARTPELKVTKETGYHLGQQAR
uniref:Purple acid phosphatase n=1 Tax=Quercus lobata TaxID=97700 RepID=A0A7N2RBC4_QUELO